MQCIYFKRKLWSTFWPHHCHHQDFPVSSIHELTDLSHTPSVMILDLMWPSLGLGLVLFWTLSCLGLRMIFLGLTMIFLGLVLDTAVLVLSLSKSSHDTSQLQSQVGSLSSKLLKRETERQRLEEWEMSIVPTKSLMWHDKRTWNVLFFRREQWRLSICETLILNFLCVWTIYS